MKSLVLGVVGIIAVLAFSVEGDWSSYAQKHSIVLVLGGTIVLLFFSTPGSALEILWRSLKVLLEKEERFIDHHDDLIALAKNRNTTVGTNNPLIKYSIELWEQGIDPNLYIALISQKRAELENETIDGVQALKNLAKYPPALGMTGTVMGMIALFSNLDSQKGNIGSALALAMTATFFGLLLTNVLLSPLADRLQVRHVNRKRLFTNIYQILLLINQDEPSQLISGELGERVA